MGRDVVSPNKLVVSRAELKSYVGSYRFSLMATAENADPAMCELDDYLLDLTLRHLTAPYASKKLCTKTSDPSSRHYSTCDCQRSFSLTECTAAAHDGKHQSLVCSGGAIAI
jgi:hypothetical protein